MTLALRWAVMRAILNVSLIVRNKVTRQCPQTTTFSEEKGEPKPKGAEANRHEENMADNIYIKE